MMSRYIISCTSKKAFTRTFCIFWVLNVHLLLFIILIITFIIIHFFSITLGDAYISMTLPLLVLMSRHCTQLLYLLLLSLYLFSGHSGCLSKCVASVTKTYRVVISKEEISSAVSTCCWISDWLQKVGFLILLLLLVMSICKSIYNSL